MFLGDLIDNMLAFGSDIGLAPSGRQAMKFHWNMFLGDLIDNMLAFGSDIGLAPSGRQAIIWTNAEPVHRGIHAALGGNGSKANHEVTLVIYYQ